MDNDNSSQNRPGDADATSIGESDTDVESVAPLSDNADGIVKQADSNQTPEKSSPFIPLVLLGLLYGVMLFLFVLGIQSGPMSILPIVACIVATVAIVAAWSVFGTGGYFQRCFMAHAVGLIPATGLFLGVLLVALNEGAEAHELYQSVLLSFLGTIVMSVGAQLPFWFLRCIWGWQFAWRDEPVARPFNLRDIFAITFVCALCIAVPRFAVGAFMESMPFQIHSDDNPMVQKVEEDGSVIFVAAETQEDIDLAWRQAEQQTLMMSYYSYGVTFVMSFIGAVLSMPIVFFVFRSVDGSTGCLLSLFYAAGVSLFVLMVIGAMVGNSPGMIEFVVYVGGLIIATCAGIAIPLVVMRESGFRFATSSNRTMAKQS